MTEHVVIIGAGQAGLTAALSLRDRGWTGGIDLVEEETGDPYQRPPLSQWYPTGTATATNLLIRTPEALARDRITLHRGVRVTELRRAEQLIVLDSGVILEYSTLILATGSTPRPLNLPGSHLAGIHAVHSVTDADGLRAELSRGGRTIFIGGGFLNLEVAIEAAKYGSATVLESSPQILGRVLSSEAAAALAAYQTAQGIEIHCNVEIARVREVHGRVAGVELANGSVIPADRIVLAIGAEARAELARGAGLATADGIIVDAGLRTSDDRIFAIGDCARFPSAYAGILIRLESVQNATDQARFVAAVIAGAAAGAAYREVPWFWSLQGERQLQIAGLARPSDEARVALRDDDGRLVVERYRDGRVVAVETINAPGPHMRARQALIPR